MDEKTFIAILRSNQGIIQKVANSYCKNRNDRDDLIQEITLQLWLSASKYDDTYKTSTWVYRVALNVAISFYRKNYRVQKLKRTLLEKDPFMPHEEENSSEMLGQLYYFISKLSELNKALILLYLDQYSYEEIGQTLGISKTNVATKLSRIKEQLRREFNNH